MSVSSAPDPAPAKRLSAADTSKLTARITWLSVSVGLSLALLKTAVWWFSGSISLLASAADSALDFVAAMGTFWAVRVAVLPADAEHRYGHGKAEAFASLLQAGLVFASAALIAREAITHFLHPQPVQDEGGAILVMVVSVIATLGLVRAQAWVIAQTRSVAIKGDRAHYLADLVSNAAAIVGIGLARLTGETRWDAVAGVLVAGWLVKGAIDVLREASNELLDREVDEADRQEILNWRRTTPKSWVSTSSERAPLVPSFTFRCTWNWSRNSRFPPLTKLSRRRRIASSPPFPAPIWSFMPIRSVCRKTMIAISTACRSGDMPLPIAALARCSTLPSRR